jgi:two-component system sensor histidine kinase/response regulator
MAAAASRRRKPLARKTRGAVYDRALLRAQLEASPDGVLVVDPAGRIVSYNRRFSELWGLPKEVLESKDDSRAIAYVLDQVSDGEAFLRRIERIYSRPDEHSEDRIALKDGRIFERQSAPVVGERGERYGRVWHFREITDRVAAELGAAETRRTHESYVNAVAGSTDGLWDWNVGTNEVYFSPRYKEMLGYRAEELEDQFSTWVGLIHPEDRERALEKVKAYQEGRIPVYELEHRLLQKDGSYRWILARGAALRDAAGKLLRMSGSHTDIDARKRAEEEVARLHEDLRRTHESYVRAVEGSTDGLWDINVPAGEAYYSPAYARMLGYEPGELPPRFDAWIGLMHPDERARNLEDVKAYDEGRMPVWEKELRLRQKDGSYRWILSRGTGLRDAHGKLLRMSGSHSDIHARKMAELALRDSELRFRQLSENIREAYWLVGIPEGAPQKTEIIYISAMWEQIWGRPLPPLERLTEVWMDALHPEDRQRVLETGARSAEGYEHQYRILRPDGEVRWVRDRAFPVKDGDGRVVRVAGVSEDITERRRLEEDLRSARDEALASANAKSEFLANVSHELRTPLNAVIGMNELLLETSLTETQRERASVARDAGRGLLALIDDLLDFTRMEAGRLPLDRAPFDPRELAVGVERMLAHKASEKGLRLSAQVGASVPAALVGDAVRLRQVLLNFVGNALKFTDAGSVELAVDCPDVSGGEATLRLLVRDTGPGISPAARSRLFTAFSQGDASVTRRHGGTGLGLAICRQIAELMGGSVGMESAPGKGSTFRFEARFPLATGALGAPSAPASRADVRGLNVLVVDDNAVNRRVTLSQLEQLGCRAQTASDGAQALALMEGGGFDIVLMDCAMPVMDGYAASAELRRREGPGRRTPVVALTAGARPEDRARCLAAGMDDHLAKPVSLDHLAAALSRWGGPLDPAALERAQAAVGQDAARWRQAYLEDAGRLIAEMARAAGAGDADALRRAAHTLKGASASLGARRLSALCARAEAGHPPPQAELERELGLVRERLAA